MEKTGISGAIQIPKYAELFLTIFKQGIARVNTSPTHIFVEKINNLLDELSVLKLNNNN